MSSRWPSRLWIVRHGESAGNVAHAAAYAGGFERIDVSARDMEVPLSPLGQKQASALGRWFADKPAEERPQVVLTSPYLRACATADAIRDSGGFSADVVRRHDERLREREFGILDRLTRVGIEKLFPDQAQARKALGKFYHRPPGGESWCDVILRLRSALDTLSLHHAGQRVLIVGHQVVVLCLRYLIEDLDEAAILAIDAEGDVANCSVTEYEATAEGLRLVRYNYTRPVAEQGAPVTRAPDRSALAR